MAMERRLLAVASLRIGTVATIVGAFLFGFAASRVYDRYARIADCQRWHENVVRWAQIVADATGELTQRETAALQLAHGAMIGHPRSTLRGRAAMTFLTYRRPSV
jgi:hypothetical protein